MRQKIRSALGLTKTGLFVGLVRSAVLLTLACEPKHVPDYWTPNGITVENISWNVSPADCFSLSKAGGCWHLPAPLPNDDVEKTMTRHVRPTKANLPDVFKSADQLVVHDAGMIEAEYYRFDKQGLCLLGFFTRDTAVPITRYDPPLLLMPPNLELIDTTVTAESVMRVWDAAADSFRNDGLCRTTFEVIERGMLSLPGGDMPALLVRMTISKDLTVNFRDNALIMTDALTVQNYVLVAQAFGPVLEWGSRLSHHDTAAMQADPLPERVIRITLHQPQKAD